jgi:hypothetical protein
MKRCRRILELPRTLACFTLSLAWVAPAWLGCSQGSSSTSVGDAGTDATDATVGDSSQGADAGPDAIVTGMKIVAVPAGPLQAAPGDALKLLVVLTLSDGTTQNLPAGITVNWSSPETVVAQDPNDAATSGVVPEAGVQPTAFYVDNNYRPTHPGVLFVVDNGTQGDAGVTVTASVSDAGQVSAVVAILPHPTGDAASGQSLYGTVLKCAQCHGQTGGGSPPIAGAPDAAPRYDLGGATYPYPAPGLNSAPDSGNLATDPAWSMGLFGMAAQADIDNKGVALRAPMPVFFAKAKANGQVVGAQDFADIYAWLKTQTQ